MMIELEERVTQLEEWTEGKGLIVQGAAGTFCSGSDLNAVRAISNPQVKITEDGHICSYQRQICVSLMKLTNLLFPRMA